MAGELDESLPGSWQICRLDEVANIIDSLHKTPTYTENGNAMVRVTDVQGGFLDLTKTLRVTDEVFQEFTRRYAPKRGDIVFSRVGSYGNASYANIDTPFCLGQNTALISPRINGRYLHLYLQSPNARKQIEQAAVGSTQKTISLKNISALEIPLPPAEELETISHILGTLDDKIELNRRMNETLEAIARAIFKSWFVDFDPVRAKASGEPPESICRRLGLTRDLLALFPDRLVDSELGEIPEGWEVKNLGAVADVNWGDTKTTKASYTDSGFVAYSATGPDGYLPGYDYERTGVVVSAIGANAGNTWIASGKWSCIKNTIRFWATDARVSTEYLFHATYGKHKWPLRGSAQPFIAQADARSISVLVPGNALAITFGKYLDVLYSKARINSDEVITLADMRDTLLPKLLSGELRVPEAESTQGALLV